MTSDRRVALLFPLGYVVAVRCDEHDDQPIVLRIEHGRTGRVLGEWRLSKATAEKLSDRIVVVRAHRPIQSFHIAYDEQAKTTAYEREGIVVTTEPGAKCEVGRDAKAVYVGVRNDGGRTRFALELSPDDAESLSEMLYDLAVPPRR